MSALIDSIENSTFNESLLQEDLYEQEHNHKKNVCEANKCIFARWIKPNVVREFMFVSKDVLMMNVGKTLIFYNIKTQKENILFVGENETAPAGGNGSLILDGIGCVDYNGTDLLALGEQPPKAKMIVCQYPDMELLVTLNDDSVVAAYKSVLLLQSEYLIGLRDHPAFDLVVWAWRVGEKLLIVDTGFVQPDQSLSLSPAGGRGVFHVSHAERDVRCRLQLWTVAVSCRMACADRTRVTVPCTADFGTTEGCCWTRGGWFVFHDGASAVVYGTRPGGGGQLAACATDVGRAGGPGGLVRATGRGFAVLAADRLTCYTETKDNFTISWTIDIHHTLCKMAAVENNVYGWSDKGALIELTKKGERVLKLYGKNIKYFTFISPVDKMIATINEEHVLQLWQVLTGEFKNEFKLNGVVTNLCSNPIFNYVAVSFKNGIVQLIKFDPKSNNINHIAKLILCEEDISSVMFSFDGKECIVTSFATGRFYRVNIDVGRSCSVTKEHHLGKRVVDAALIDNQKSSFLTVLYGNLGDAETAGNNIIIFDENFKVVFKLNDTQHYYSSTFKWMSFVSSNVINVALTVMLSRQVHLITINIVQKSVLEFDVIPLDHDLRKVNVFAGESYCLTFCNDGVYNLYEFDDDGRWNKVVMVNCCHWQTGGLKAARTDFNACNILTLSGEGNLLCTSFNDTCKYIRRSRKAKKPLVVPDMETRGIGFENELGKRMTWEMIKEENELKASQVTYTKQKNQIIQNFNAIKKQLLDLFETNLNGPDDLKIGVEAFELNDDYKQWYKEKCALERREYEEKILEKIKTLHNETEDILKKHWETWVVKPKSIHCIKRVYKVDNYAISVTDQKITNKANEIRKKRLSKMNEEFEMSSSTTLATNTDSMSDDETVLEENHVNSALTGSISHRFIDSIDVLNPQYNYHILEMAKSEIVLLQHMINMLKHSFNELFDDLCDEKQHYLDISKERSKRLLVIENEFILACKIESTEPPIVDYEWNQYEKTEQLTYVQDHEVSVKPYREVSEEKISDDGDSKQKERYKQLLASDNFRRKALIHMMDGVLEKRWEDELKKDVPRPQCMVQKNVEDYTEDDLKAIEEYDKATAALNDERRRYKNMLEEEKTKIQEKIIGETDELDNTIINLFNMKLKYDSAIYQERLKIKRLSKMLSDYDHRREQIELYKDNQLELEKTIEETVEIISTMKDFQDGLLSNIETMKLKKNIPNNKLKSKFKSTFSKGYKQALQASNRIPKFEDGTYSPLLGYQFIDKLMSPTEDKVNVLSLEFVKYLHTLREYDDYNYVYEKKLDIDMDIWKEICNLRRNKIESKFRLETYQKDIADKNILLEHLKHSKKEKETMIEQFKLSINELETQDLHNQGNLKDFQLVITQGHVEIKLSGHFEDFENTSLELKEWVDKENNKIKEMGKAKLKMLTNYQNCLRKGRLLKLEHDILKSHQLELYKYRYNYIHSLILTEEMIYYLKVRNKETSFSKLIEHKVNKRREIIIKNHLKKKEELNRYLKDLINQIDLTTNLNKNIDKQINQVMNEQYELKKKIDQNLSDQMKLATDSRMKGFAKRSQMVIDVQELHKEVVVLEAELKVLRLKTISNV